MYVFAPFNPLPLTVKAKRRTKKRKGPSLIRVGRIAEVLRNVEVSNAACQSEMCCGLLYKLLEPVCRNEGKNEELNE